MASLEGRPSRGSLNVCLFTTLLSKEILACRCILRPYLDIASLIDFLQAEAPAVEECENGVLITNCDFPGSEEMDGVVRSLNRCSASAASAIASLRPKPSSEVRTRRWGLHPSLDECCTALQAMASSHASECVSHKC